MKLRTTHSLATLPISKEAYEEIRNKLLAHSYNHAILKTGLTGEMIDMNGIALVVGEEEEERLCIVCNKKVMGTGNVEGKPIHYECYAGEHGEEEIQPKEELTHRDKNYYLSKENK